MNDDEQKQVMSRFYTNGDRIQPSRIVVATILLLIMIIVVLVAGIIWQTRVVVPSQEMQEFIRTRTPVAPADVIEEVEALRVQVEGLELKVDEIQKGISVHNARNKP